MAYTAKQKEEAVTLAHKIGLVNASKELKIGLSTLWAWKNSVEFAHLDSNYESPDSERIRSLELENAKMRQSNKLLLEALSAVMEDTASPIVGNKPA